MNNYHEQSDHDLIVGLCVRLDVHERQRAEERKIQEGRCDNHGKRIGRLERASIYLSGVAAAIVAGVMYFKEEIKHKLGLRP